MEQIILLSGEKVTVTLSGRLGRQEAVRLHSRLREYRGEGYRSFTIDVRNLDASSAAEVSMLLGLRKRTVSCSGRLAIQEISGEIGAPNFTRCPAKGRLRAGKGGQCGLYFAPARELNENKRKILSDVEKSL